MTGSADVYEHLLRRTRFFFQCFQKLIAASTFAHCTHYFGKQSLLVLEVTIQSGLGDFGMFGDRIHGNRPKAIAQKQLACRFDDLQRLGVWRSVECFVFQFQINHQKKAGILFFTVKQLD